MNNAAAAQNSTVTVGTVNGLAFGPGVSAPTVGGLAGGGNVNLATTDASPLPVVLTAGGNNTSTTYGGALSGSGSLTKAGAGDLILTGSNTYSGQTTIGSGTLQIGSGGTTGSINSTSGVSDSGVLAFDLSSSVSISQAITGTGSLVQMGLGAASLTGSNAYAGGTTINGGILQFNGDSTVPATGTVTINAGGALALASSGTLYTSVDGWLNSGKIAPASAGALALIANDSETINMGSYASLSLGASGNVTYSGTLTPSGSTYNLGGGGGTLTFAPAITGAVSLNVRGPGTVVLMSSNAYSGATRITAGRLTFAPGPVVTNPLVSYTFDGTTGTLDTTGTYDSVSGGTWSTSGTFNDTTGNGNTITMFSWGGTLNVIPGKYNQAVSFPGGSVRLQTQSPLSGGTLNAWTDSVWVNLSAATLASYNSYLMSGRQGSTDALGFDTWINSSGIVTEIPGQNSGGGRTWISNQGSNAVTIAPNTWTLITQTVTTGLYQLYVNGQLVGTQTLDSSYTPFFAESSAYLALGVNDFQGSMDEFKLYNSVLSATQIQSLYYANVPDGYGALPATSNVQLASGATLDLTGISQTVAGLANYSGSGGTVTNNGPIATLTVGPVGASTFSGVIQDGASQVSLTVNGPGTQILLGTNTYSGVTTISGGTLQLGNGAAAGSIDNSSGVVNNGALVFNRSDNVVFAAPISGSGALVQAGGGNLAFSRVNNSYTGPTYVNRGTLRAAPPGATNGLVFHFGFEEGTIGTTLPDRSTMGTSNGYTMYTWESGVTYSAGKFGVGITTNSSNGIPYVGGYQPAGNPVTPIPALNAWTDSVWVQLTSDDVTGSGWTALMSTGWNSPNSYLRLFYVPQSANWDHLYGHAGFYCQIGAADGGWAINDWGPGNGIEYDSMDAGNWHMITQTVNTSDQYSFYIDGQLIGTYALNGDTPLFAQSSASLTLGFDPGGRGNASFDELNLFSSVLNSQQISQLYADEAPISQARCRPRVR